MKYQATVTLESRTDQISDWRIDKMSWDEKVEYLWETKYGCDVSIKIKNKKEEEVFKAHRFILSMSSNVLEKIINSEVFKIPGEATIVFTNISPEVIDIFLNFIYTKTGTPKTNHHAIELYRIAQKLNVPDLKEVAYRYIENNLTYLCVLETFIFADIHGINELKQRCISIIQNQTREVINEQNIMNIDLHSMIVILEQPALNIKEIELFNFVKKWIYSRQEGDICVFTCNQISASDMLRKLQHCLLARIRFLSMTAEEFMEGPMKSGMLSKVDELAILGHIVSKTCTLNYPICFNRRLRMYMGDIPKRDECPKQMDKDITFSNSVTPKKMSWHPSIPLRDAIPTDDSSTKLKPIQKPRSDDSLKQPGSKKKMPQPSKKISEPAKKVTEPAKKILEPTTKTSESTRTTPEPAMKTSDSKRTTLEPACKTPETPRTPPEPGRNTPDTSRTTPEPGRNTPETPRTPPEPGRNTPESARTTPEPGRMTPKSAMKSSLSGRSTPVSGRSTPKESVTSESETPEVTKMKTPSIYRTDKDGSTPPPTIGLQQVSSIVPPFLKDLGIKTKNDNIQNSSS